MAEPRVLIVEDEGIIAQDLRMSLRRLGYAVSGVVSTGAAAIEHARASRPDVALMDVGLPGGISGVEAAAQIQARHGIPVIFLTAHADPATIQKISAVNPAGYIVKPFHQSELQRAIQHALTSKPAPGSAN